MSSIDELKKKFHKKLDILDLELIIAHIIKKPREFILTYPEYKLAKSQIANLKLQISRRLRGEPIAYILGHKEFYGLNFKINKNTLVPRPETELIIDEVLKIIRKKTKNKKYTIIDIGTGSGCIIISILKNLKNFQFPISSFQFLATDISRSALNIARQNAKLNKINTTANKEQEKINFLHGNLLTPIIKSKNLNLNSKIIITANLPYLTPIQIKNSPSIKKEPKLALSAGKDGLKYYRELFKQIKSLHIDYNVLCEIDPSQSIRIKKLIKDTFPKAKIKIKKDLNGLNRIAIIQI